jgi:pimeloyl-ACP methyl ester carboxylesterase
MHRRAFTNLCLAGAAWVLRPWRSGADEVEDLEPTSGKFNAVTPTLGGKQFWADELFFHDWHIQRNVFTGHYRLLDGYHLRHAWGTFEECRGKLERIKTDRGLPAMRGPAVIVLHGLFRTPTSMNKISRFLREQGYTVFNVSYPTTRGSVAEHARSLARIIENLDGIDELNFVGHSLGNLVVRHYLADHTHPEDGLRPDARIKRIVMLGAPNQGAQIAEALGSVGLFHAVAGASGSQLAREWDSLKANLATPECEFGILAGGRSTEKGFNPLLTGDNDLVVSVDSTRLAGAADFAVLPVIHSLMMNDRTVMEYTLRFLRHGYFISAEARRPIPPADTAQIARENGASQRGE